MVTIGALIGAFLSRYFLMFFTRKNSLFIADLIGLTSLFTLIPNRNMIIIFRLVLGISNGISIGILPTYVREICPETLY